MPARRILSKNDKGANAVNNPLASQEEHQRTSFAENTWLRQIRGLGYIFFGKPDQGITYVVGRLKNDPYRFHVREVRYLIKHQVYQETRDYLENLSDENSENRAEIKFLLAQCYIGQGLVGESRNAVQEALEIEPERAEYWDLLADCFLEQGQWQEATACLDKSLRAAPTRAETLFRLGTIYSYNEEHFEALRCFQGCCQLKPHNPVYWEMKAETHLKLEQIEQACHSFERALRYSANIDVAARLAYCYIQLEQIKKGIRHYELVLKHEPDHFDALSNLAAVYQNQDRSLEALNLLERAHSVHPNDPILLNNMGYTLVHLGRTRKATEYYQAALRLAPDHPLIMYNLSVCLVKRGNWEEAVRYLEKLLEIDPEHSEAWALLGNIYDQLRQYDVATDCFNHSLRLA